MSCKHEHLKTVNDMLICKDCGNQLPLSFLTDRGKKKGKDETPSPVVQAEVAQEGSDSAEIPTENQPVESQTNKSTPEKKPRKNAKKGA